MTRRGLILLAMLGLALPAAAMTRDKQALVDQIRFEQRLGQRLPTTPALIDEQGRQVSLGRYFTDRPVILLLGYYSCDNLCDSVLDSLVNTLNKVDLKPGKDYELVSLSIDPRDGPAQARQRKAHYTRRYANGNGVGWHFLTGPAEQIRRVAQAGGFGYAYDEKLDEYLHGAGLVLATADGVISRYLLGVNFTPRDLRLGLVEASANRIGSPVDQLLLRCFTYDPQTGRYGAAILDILRATAVLMVVMLALTLGVYLRRERRGVQGHER